MASELVHITISAYELKHIEMVHNLLTKNSLLDNSKLTQFNKMINYYLVITEDYDHINLRLNIPSNTQVIITSSQSIQIITLNQLISLDNYQQNYEINGSGFNISTIRTYVENKLEALLTSKRLKTKDFFMAVKDSVFYQSLVDRITHELLMKIKRPSFHYKNMAERLDRIIVNHYHTIEPIMSTIIKHKSISYEQFIRIVGD
ncbi:MAG: hypothetical protein RBQ70_04235 [Acholeplasma sp.]|jgi:hypothetical protein|nr:hypothetical protein [Acholeplasma sp.]